MTHGWTADEEGSGDSHHVRITTTLSIRKPTFTPRRQRQRTDWTKFAQTMGTIHPAANNYKILERTQATAEAINAHLQQAINTAIPWSKPNQKSKSWWSPEITHLKNAMATANKHVYQTLDNEGYKAESKNISAKWGTAIRIA
ncbi:hypothetical protein Q9L58_010436 [Maublancomyces gigas]|uniref:Uncharacterized protein n=1 Tax=Discina gigas TaxID=1032678 RepID=A0ABR3G4K0_9PEZI